MLLKIAWSGAAVLAFWLAVKWWVTPALEQASNGLFLTIWTK